MRFCLWVDCFTALRAGNDVIGEVYLDVPAREIPVDLCPFLEEVTGQYGTSLQPVKFIQSVQILYPKIGEATRDSLIKLLQFAQAESVRIKAEQDARIENEKVEQENIRLKAERVSIKIQELTPEEVVQCSSGNGWVDKDLKGWHAGSRNGGCPIPFKEELSDSVIMRLSGMAKNVLKRAMELLDKQDAAAEAEQEAKREKRRVKRKEQLDGVVARLGTDVQKRKWAAGLMAVQEAAELWVAYVAKPLKEAGFTIVSAEECIQDAPIEGVTIREYQLDKVSDELFESMEKAKTLVPQTAEVLPFVERCTYDAVYAGEEDDTIEEFLSISWKEGELKVDIKAVPPAASQPS